MLSKRWWDVAGVRIQPKSVLMALYNEKPCQHSFDISNITPYQSNSWLKILFFSQNWIPKYLFIQSVFNQKQTKIRLLFKLICTTIGRPQDPYFDTHTCRSTSSSSSEMTSGSKLYAPILLTVFVTPLTLA